MKHFYLFLIVSTAFLLNGKLNAQVTITKPNLTIAVCSGYPSGYSALGNIVITETTKADFSVGTNVNLILTAPTNFEFRPGYGAVTVAPSANLLSASIVVTASTITITYTCGFTNKFDIMTLSGLQIRAMSASSGNITRTNGTGIINSLINTTALTNGLTSSNTTPIITSQPSAKTVCTNGTTTFSVTATGATSYQWRKNGVILTNSAPYSGVTTATLSITNPSVSENGSVFDVVTSSATPCSITSSSAVLTVFEKVVITNQPILSQFFCEGHTASISIEATGDGLTYQWYKESVAMTDGGTISGTTSSTLTISPLVLSDGATYHCVVAGSGLCNPVPSNNSVLNINLDPVIDTLPAIIQTVCEGSPVSISMGTTVGTFSYQWYKGATALANGGTLSGATTATLTISSASPADASLEYNCIINNGCSTVTTTSGLIVNPKPNAVATPISQTICSTNAIATIVLSGNVTGTIFNWTRNNTAVTGIADNGSDDISGSLTNTTNAPVTVTFTITPTANGCSGTPITATVVVNPTPNVVATFSSQIICSGNAITTMTLSGNVSGTTYNWTRDNTVVVTGIASSGSGNISGSLTNTTTNSQTVTFSITPTKNGCSGTPITATIVVEKISIGGTITPAVTTVCANSNTGTLTLSSNLGTIIRWEYSINGGVDWLPISNTTNTQTYTNLSQTRLYRAVVENGVCPIVYSTNAAISVISSFVPIITGTPLTICAGESAILSATSSGLPTGGISDGSFSQGNPLGWCVNNVCTGSFLPANGDNQDVGMWRESNPHTFNGVSYSSPDPKFAITNGLFNSTLETPVFSLIGQTNVNLQILEAYILEAGASAKIEISTNGGSTYTNILKQYNGASTLGISGTTATMQSTNISLANYVGLSNLRIRFSYTGTANSGWVIDGISVPYVPVPVVYTWTSNATLTPSSGIGQTVTANPTTTTTYTLTTTALGCAGGSQNITITVNQLPVVTAFPTTICSGSTSNLPLTSSETLTTFSWTAVQTNVSGASAGSGNTIAQTLTATGSNPGTVVYTIIPTSKGCVGVTKLVTITVNPRPTARINTEQTICNGGTATFSIDLTGVAPWNITYTNGTTTTTVSTSSNPYFFSIDGLTSNKTYTLSALSDARCTAIPTDLTGSSNVTVLTGTQGLWTGLVSSDWFDCTNWAGGLPSNTIDAQIPAGKPRMPIIDKNSPFAASYSNIAKARDLIIAVGASVTIVNTNDSELQISRDWKNSGTFIPGTGTVTFNGGTLNQIQNINLGIKTNETFYNLTTNNSAGAKGISVVDGFELTVSNNLSLLSGDLRLTGEAQLIQEGIWSNPTAGSGVLLRDQQGQQNSYNYNYWCSPVSSDNYSHYSVGGVLRDGTDATNVISVSNFNQKTITFGNGVYFADSPLSSPIKISNRWISSYGELTPTSNSDWDNYYQWKNIGNTGYLEIGEGYTMKGTGGIAPIDATQNYVFAGKPNSGIIPLGLILNDTHLIGNPYPSALDANQFIRDNLRDCTGCTASDNIFNGVLYFWDHFGLSNNHLLLEYEGGNATYTLMGGVRAISDVALTANNGLFGSKIPGRYIPVGQGFFVDAVLDTSLPAKMPKVDGGILIFKNSQRVFAKESSGNSTFVRTRGTLKEEKDTRSKIRLGFDSAVNTHRQILIGADSYATELIDIGYEAKMDDVSKNDMYWELQNIPFVIQAVPDFNTNRIIPLGIVVANEGSITIKIDALENMSANPEIYLYDNLTGEYHNLIESNFSISLDAGKYRNRFHICFSDKTLGLDKTETDDGIFVMYSNNYKMLIIKNNAMNSTVNAVTLFNILGQPITNWKVENQGQTNIQIPIKNIASGIYITKLQTSKGEVSKKIIVN